MYNDISAGRGIEKGAVLRYEKTENGSWKACTKERKESIFSFEAALGLGDIFRVFRAHGKADSTRALLSGALFSGRLDSVL